MLNTGDTLAARFIIQGEIGHGGMGVVYRALDTATQELVAVKVLAVQQSNTQRRFQREASLLAQISHPNIVRHISHGETSQGQLYLVMEWLEGEELSAKIARGRLSIEEATTLMLGIAEGLGAAHQHGIIHRDLKPQNIFLCKGTSQIKLLDFGIARQERAQEQEVTATGMIMGTPGYLAPEQATRGAKGLDSRADIFSLGCVFFECLTGRRPFLGDNALAVLSKILLADPPKLRALLPEASDSLERLLQEMLSKQPAERPADGAALRERLQALEQGRAPKSPPQEKATITEDEQSLICMIFIGQPPAQQNQEVTHLDTASIQGLVAPFGGQAHVLLDGSRWVLFSSRSAAIDLALQASRCALTLQKQADKERISLTMGLANLSSSSFVGEAIDRAVALLQRPEPTSGVKIDELIAGFIAGHFELNLEEMVLLRERETPEIHYMLPLIGRDRELQTLLLTADNCFEEAVSRTILLSGAAGLGKSRLWRELLTRLEQRPSPPQILWAQGDPMRAAAPFGLLSGVLRRRAGIHSADPVELQVKKLSGCIDDTWAAEPRAILLELAGVTPREDGPQDPQQKSEERARTLEAFLRSELQRGPLLIALEDLHWADPASVALLCEVIKSLPDEPIMLLFTGRLEVRRQFPDLFSANTLTELQLGELPRKTTEKAIQRLFPSASPADISQLVSQSQGNAFFLEELCRAYRAGALARPGSLPKTLLASVHVRLSALPLDCRRILRAASIFGERFWPGGLALLLGHKEKRDIEHHIALLISNEIFAYSPESRFAKEEELVFRHALYREAAYETLTDEDKSLGNRLAGEWLVRAGEQDAAMLARQFELGGDNEAAISWYTRAAQKSLDANQLKESLGYTARAVSLGASGVALGELRKIEAEIYFWSGEMTSIVALGTEILHLLPKDGASFYRTAALILGAHFYAGMIEFPERWVEALSARPLLPSIASAQIYAWSMVSWLLLVGGRYTTARPLVERLSSVEESELDSYEPLAVGWFYTIKLFSYFASNGNLWQAKKYSSKVLESFERAKDLRALLHARLHVSTGLIMLGRQSEGIALLEGIYKEADKYNFGMLKALAKRSIATALLSAGDLDEAQRVSEELIEERLAANDLLQTNNMRAGLAKLFLRKGAWAQAEENALLASVVPSITRRMQVFFTLARAQFAQGKIEMARESMLSGESIFEAQRRDGHIDEESSLDFAELLFALQEITRAKEILRATYQKIKRAAEQIEDPACRETFLQNISDTRRIIFLATEWGIA